jgi:hypothetical protein
MWLGVILLLLLLSLDLIKKEWTEFRVDTFLIKKFSSSSSSRGGNRFIKLNLKAFLIFE